MDRLTDKIALITGGSSGIGLATAKRFIAEGAEVVIAGRRREQLDEALNALGPRATGVQADVTRLEDIDRLIGEIRARHGRLDIVFANAGGGGTGRRTVEAMSEADYDVVFDQNVKSVFFTVQKALPLMPDGGAIVLTTSIANVKGLPGAGGYGAAKAAVRSFARTWTNELRGRGIRVNAISPGPIDTPLHNSVGEGDPRVAKMIEGMMAAIPVGRIGRPEEVAAAVAFLSSAEAGFITGAELCIDGGLTMI